MKTKKIEKMNPEACGEIRARVTLALKPIAEELGIRFGFGTMKYDPIRGTASFRVEATMIEIGGKSQEQAAFEANASMFGLLPEEYGAQLINPSTGNTIYKLVGLLPKRSKYCVELEDVASGKRLLFREGILNQIPTYRERHRAAIAFEKSGQLTQTPPPPRPTVKPFEPRS